MDYRTLWILTILPVIAGQCTFPDSFNGTWITSYDGTWVTNSTHLLGYKAVSPTGVFLNSGNPTLDFTCFTKSGTKYILKSTSQVELFTNILFDIYTCLDLREITSSKYVFYYGRAAENNTGLRFTTKTTLEEVCTQTDHDLAYNQHIALLNGSETSGLTLCPPSIYGSYFYNTCNDTNSNTTDLDVCDSRQQLIFNYTLCNTLQMFTSEGVLDCLFYDDVDTVSYVTLYNRDSTTPNRSTTYQFVCLAIELNGTTVHITANPETCTENQSPTTIASPGQILELEPYFLCPFTDESSFDFLPIILGIVGFLLLVTIIIIIYCCCKHCKCCNKKKRKKTKRSKKKKKKKKNDEEDPSDDEDDRSSDSDSSKDSESTRSTSSSKYEPQYFEEEENKSVDSGISEPAVAHKKDGKDGDEGDEGQTEKVLVIYYEVENELDDKTSRPHSGQVSRMSDLPPSSFADDDQPGTSRSDPDQHNIQDGNLDDKIDETQLKDPPETEETNDKEDDTADNEEQQVHTDEHVKDDEGSGEEEESEDDNDDGANDNTKSLKENDEVQKETTDDEKDQTKESFDSEEHTDDNEVQKEDDTDEEETSPIEDKAEDEDGKEDTLEEENAKENDSENESETEGDTVDKEKANGGKEDDAEDDRADIMEPEQDTGKPDKVDTTTGDDGTSTLGEKDDDNESDVHNEDTITKEDNETQEIKHEQNGTPDIDSEDNMNEVTRDNEHDHPQVIVVAAPKHEDADAQTNKSEETEEESEAASDEDDEDPPRQSAVYDQEHAQKRVTPDDDNFDKTELDEKDEHDKEPTTGYETEKEVIFVQPTRLKDEDGAGDNAVTDKHREDSDNDDENVKAARSEDRDAEDGSKEEPTGRKKQHTRRRSDEEMSKEYHKIGGKKGKGQQEFKSLTKVLVSRDGEDKRRNKNRERSKNQKMRKLAKRKTLKHGTKGGKEGDVVIEDDYMSSSEDDVKETGGGRQAPFIAQYNNKKRIEHILEQQHYWSDPDAEESFGINDNTESTLGSSGGESDSDYEELIGPDGVIHRVKRSRHKYNDKDELDKEIPGTKRPKSVESMASVEDPESPGGHVSKKRQNDHHALKNVDQERKEKGKESDKHNDYTPDKGSGTSTPKLIYVKEKKADKKTTRDKGRKDTNDANDGTKTSKGRKKTLDMGDNVSDISDIPSDFCDTDMDKLSERDSGLDDDEAVDVVLNTDQQAMIVAMLFDKEMNLRPQFARDDAGRIIRRLDNTVIYDPHTGRFTFHKQLGKIFNVPRLKRDTKGRPIGGYVDDPFGPHESDMRRRTPGSGEIRRTASGKSIRTHVTSVTGSPSPEMKRSRGEGKFVGFAMPIEDDIESVTTDQLDINIRGRRDIGSAIRRKLNKRLFRKKRKNPAISALPDITLKRAWGQDGTMTVPDRNSSPMGTRGLTSLGIPFSRSGPTYGTPGTQRRQLGNMDPEQQQMYKQGLERDRKILEERQDKLNKKPFEAFTQQNGDEEETDDMDKESVNGEYDSNRSSFYGQSFYNDDGRLVIRERGCPEVHRPSTFFTIVRRQEDLEAETAGDNDENASFDRVSKSAPASSMMSLQLKSRDAPNGFHKENTFHNGARRDGSDSQLSGIDNNRLRRLLEELYKDKKYFDDYINSKEPESEEFILSKGLAEHGRGYLLERAEYWDKRGPQPSKPPMTEIGWKMHRQQTLIESRLNSDRSSAAILNGSRDDERDTVAPPGVIEEQSESGNNGETDVNESNA